MSQEFVKMTSNRFLTIHTLYIGCSHTVLQFYMYILLPNVTNRNIYTVGKEG